MNQKHIPNQTQKWMAVANTLFIGCVWYAVLVDTPLALELMLPRTSGFYQFVHDLNTSYQVPWFKLGKDLLLVFSLFFVVFANKEKWRLSVFFHSPIVITYTVMILLIPILALASFWRNGLWTGLAGLRSNFPLLAFIVGLHWRKEHLQTIWSWSKPLYFLQIGFVFVQRILHLDFLRIYTYNRSVGTFGNPNVVGVLLCLFIVLILYFEELGIKSWAYALMGVVAVPLTRSRTAVLLLLLVAFVYVYSRLRNPKLRIAILGIALLSLPFMPWVLGQLSGRPNALHHYLSIRGAPLRRHILKGSWGQILLGEGLGRGTNLMRLIRPVTGIPVTWLYFDSLVGSLLAQGGFLLVLVTWAFILSPLLKFEYHFLRIIVPAFTFGLIWTMPAWEAWPINLLLLSLYGVLARQEIAAFHSTDTTRPTLAPIEPTSAD
jgi:hypothetical protein